MFHKNIKGVYCMKTWKHFTFMAILAIFGIVVVFIACDNGNGKTTDPSGTLATELSVGSVDEWDTALATIQNGMNGVDADSPKEYQLNVNGNIDIPGNSNFGNVQHIKVTVNGNGTLSLSSNGSIFFLRKNQNLIIDSTNLILQGKDSNNGPIIYNYGGILEMQNGTIRDNNTNSSPGGGGVYVTNNGVFNMSGGNINGNTINQGGGVCIDDNSIFIMSGGNINGNTTRYVGGGVYVRSGTFTMSGGSISDNTVTENAGGGVYISGDCTFNMSGGTISGNTTGSYGGGGVNIIRAIFNMSGGIISNNTTIGGGISGGGGVLVYEGLFNKTGGGIIYGYDNATDPLWNKSIDFSNNIRNTYGHAVQLYTEENGSYYRDSILNTSDNIRTDQLPDSGTGYNWTKQ
jgi:hypothetical protein